MKRLVLLALAWVPVIVGLDAVSRAGRLVDLASAPNPYFIPSQGWLLYLLVPAVTASAGIALLTPGLLLAWSSRREGDAVWLMRATAISLLVVSVGASLAGVVLGTPVTGRGFIAVLAILSLGAAVMTRRSWQHDEAPSGSGFAIALAVLVPCMLIAALTPKLFWESVNGDGAHAYETTRLAVRQFVPFWDPAAGPISGFPGMSTVLFAYPASWFMRLFGETEAAVRLPYFLVLVATGGAVVALAERGRATLGRLAHALVWMSLVTYTIVQAYSSTYDPYSADLSMPGLPDTVQIFTFLGFVHSHLSRRWGWTTAFLVLTLMSSPAGLALVAFWLAAIVVCGGRKEWPAARTTGALLVVVMIGMTAMPAVLGALSLPKPGSEHGLTGLLKRFAFLQFTDWRRLLWVIVPSGIFPFVAFAIWKRIDVAGRALLVVTAAHFGLFFFQAHVMIHQFAPAMLLPLAALWRRTDAGWRPWQGTAAGLLAAMAVWLSVPVNAAPVIAARVVGQTILDTGGGYAELAPPAYARLFLLNRLFPEDYKPEVPRQTYGGSPLAWGIYSRGNAPAPADINYVLIGPGAPAPEGARLYATNEAGALYVKDEDVLARHRALRPPTPAGSRVYRTPRGILFRGGALDDGPWILDLPAWLARMGVDVEGLARKLGK